MRKLSSSDDVIEAIERTLARLDAGEISVEEARASGNLLKGAIKAIELEMEHAMETGRLLQGSNALPMFRRGAHSKEALTNAKVRQKTKT